MTTVSPEVIERHAGEISKRFMWRQNGGEFIHPSEMKTRQLFHTLRMIWNHTMPEAAKITPYNKYRFGSYYTNEYTASAVKHLSAELSKRLDMSAIQKFELGQMLSHLGYQVNFNHPTRGREL